MNKRLLRFYKIYSWIYLVAVLFGIFYHYYIEPVEVSAGITQAHYNIAYFLVSAIWLIPVIGLFLFSFSKYIPFIFSIP